MTRAELGDVLWEFEGRIGRAQFWIGRGVVLGLAVGYMLVVVAVAWIGYGAAAAILWVGLVFNVLWMDTAVSVKR